ncbi:MAG TPA: fimbrial biogenesis outer membrane usher protein, partial [Rhizobiales bacterium]|nr:fimbrial biogenesis outer membrane usher protein [Hyphomicrobiales bacterium]
MARFRQKHRYDRNWWKALFAGFFVILVLMRPVQPAFAAGPTPLYLEVFINGQSTRLIAAFKRYEDGRISTTLSELKEVGLKPVGATPSGDEVFLADISGLKYEYNEEKQSISITTGNETRIAKKYNAGPREARADAAPPGFGAVLNYAINAAASNNLKMTEAGFDGVSALLDGWIYTPVGVFASSAIVSSQKDNGHYRRLDTTWTYSDQKSMRTYTIGDIVSNGPVWARPVRLGGVRISRNFRLRPDLVTVPLATVSGSAAVPSTVDIYIKNVKVHSQDVAAGPFALSNIPSVSGSGTARVVVRDATGRETESYADFFTAPELLAPGLLDFSIEAGLARRNFGEKSFDYDKNPYVSASARYGWSDSLTINGHAEAGLDLALVGGGIIAPVAKRALINLAGAVSAHKSGTGFLAYASVETSLFGLSINAQTQRTFGDFRDIASLTFDPAKAAFAAPGIVLSGAEFPKALDRISIGIPVPAWKASLNASFIHTRVSGSPTNNIFSLSLSKQVFGRASLYATAFSDLNDMKAPSVFVGLSIPLGGWGNASFGGSRSPGKGWRATTTYSKPMTGKPGSFGWRIEDQEGDTSQRNGTLSYKSRYATLEGRVAQTGNDLEYSAYADGAFVMSKDGFFATNRVDEAFAIVDAGAPGIPV